MSTFGHGKILLKKKKKNARWSDAVCRLVSHRPAPTKHTRTRRQITIKIKSTTFVSVVCVCVCTRLVDISLFIGAGPKCAWKSCSPHVGIKNERRSTTTTAVVCKLNKNVITEPPGAWLKIMSPVNAYASGS